jgi:RNA polymerase sigma-70 factor (ECF subfamily)
MRTESLNDTDLVRQFVNHNDTAAFETLIARYRKKVYTYIFLHVKRKDVADDIFQETLYKVIRTLKGGRYAENGKFFLWLSRIARNKVIDFFRHQQLHSEYFGNNGEWTAISNENFSDLNAEDKAIHLQIRKDVRQMLDMLPADLREVIIMHHYLDLNFREIAEQLNISLNTALGRMRYAIMSLRKILETSEIMLEM